MSDGDGKPKSENVVQRPDLHLIDSAQGMPPNTGPVNLVEALELEPFDPPSEYGQPLEPISVLSLWTERYQDPPIQFLLSESALEKFERKLLDDRS